MFGHNFRTQRILAITGFALVVAPAAFAQSGPGAQPYPSDPALITSDQLPKDVKQGVYSKPVRVREITSGEVLGRSYYDSQQTVVGDKVKDLENQLSQLQANVSSLISDVNNVQKMNEGKAAQYYADVATISTQLQSGTTPGNPRLVKRLTQAEANLEDLGGSVATLNTLAAEASTRASESAYLLEATRAAYSLSGAIEEDHVRLAELEDAVNSTSVIIERLLNNVNDDITRTATYLNSERNNLRSLAIGVNNGDLYGKALGNRPFSSAGVFQASATSDMGMNNGMGGMAATPAVSGGMSPGMRPLVKIRFDKPEVNYEQPVYMAVNEALQRYPNARFELVAVHPTEGNAAQVAIESTRARRNAEKVLRTLTQMGLDLERINLSYAQSPEAHSSEVHLYIR